MVRFSLTAIRARAVEQMELRGYAYWSTAELVRLGDRVVIVGRGSQRIRARHRGSLPVRDPLYAPWALLLAVADRLRRRHFAAPSTAARAGVRDAIVLTAAAGACLALSITGAAVAMGTL